jgi:arylsulfatase A-like enzyme
MDLVASGKDYPEYVPSPSAYHLGDPPSDEDADQDHEGTNVGAPDVRHLRAPGAQAFDVPSVFPSDRWLAEATVRIIQAEDPDVLYIDLANSDTAQHLFGAADRPEEWTDPGTPAQLWDDENVYNRNANRDPVLDVIHEADWDFGLITDTLNARQPVGSSLVVLLSDHSQVTSRSNMLNPSQVLLDAGITASDIERMVMRGNMGILALANPAKAPVIEATLEAYEVFDPLEGVMVKPFVVLDRDEMDTGVDTVEGPVAQDGIPGNRLGELYSEWSIDVPVTDNSKVRWPDLFIFMRSHYVASSTSSLAGGSGSATPLHGTHGSRGSDEAMVIMGGPGIRAGVYGGGVSLADIAPTLYRLLGVAPPGNVNGRSLDEILTH